MSSQDPPAAALAEIARQATEAQDEATTFLRQLVACETAVRSPVTPEFLAETRKCRSLVSGMLERALAARCMSGIRRTGTLPWPRGFPAAASAGR